MTMILTSVTMVGWADLPDSDRGDFRRRRAVDITSFKLLYKQMVGYICIIIQIGKLFIFDKKCLLLSSHSWLHYLNMWSWFINCYVMVLYGIGRDNLTIYVSVSQYCQMLCALWCEKRDKCMCLLEFACTTKLNAIPRDEMRCIYSSWYVHIV